MSWKSTAALLALSVFGVGSLVYLLFKKDEEDEFYYPKDYWDETKTFKDFFLFRKSKAKVIEIKIPKECVGIVIGINGSTIKEIEQKAGVKIKIKDDSESNEYKKCLVRGTAEGVQFAESLIHEVIISQPLIETYEMYIPVLACNNIIGKKGSTVRLISRNSNAKIIIENAPTSPVTFERKVIIKGTAEQIAIAKTLIEQKLEEALELRNKLETLMSNKPPRNQSKYLLPAKNKSEEIEDTKTYKHKEKFNASTSNGLLEVYVSAIESPDRFWLQMMGPLTVELDRLCEQMTDYYSKDESKELHRLREVKKGQIVAAPFIYDDKWYRAEVLEIQNNVDDNDNVLLYYVDYGNSSQCKKSTIYELRTDFLRLRFQAIECMLARIKPRGSTWSDDAVEALEDLTHAALWKSLIAKIHTYETRSQKVTREGSPMPCVDLYDTHGEKTIDIAEELVERGYADWEEGKAKHSSFKDKIQEGGSSNGLWG